MPQWPAFHAFLTLPPLDKRRAQAGQIGVIVLLIMVVLLTIGLSIAARTTQELFLSQQNAESSRVFNAAEAGIEEALSSQLNFQGQELTGTLNSVNNVAVDYSVLKVNVLETKLFQGVSVMTTLEPVGYSDGQRVQIDWSKTTACGANGAASLLVSIYSEVSGETRMRQEALGGCDHNDGFITANTVDVNGYRRQSFITLRNNGTEQDLFIRIKPLYNDTDIRVSGDGWQLPVQYYNIRSEARNQQGNETRIVEVNRTLPTAPSIMDFALYSGNTLVK